MDFFHNSEKIQFFFRNSFVFGFFLVLRQKPCFRGWESRVWLEDWANLAAGLASGASRDGSVLKLATVRGQNRGILEDALGRRRAP